MDAVETEEVGHKTRLHCSCNNLSLMYQFALNQKWPNMDNLSFSTKQVWYMATFLLKLHLSSHILKSGC